MKFGSKKPEKIPMYVYYIIAGIVIILLNMLVVPAVQERSIQKTDYSTFIENVEKVMSPRPLWKRITFIMKQGQKLPVTAFSARLLRWMILIL